MKEEIKMIPPLHINVSYNKGPFVEISDIPEHLFHIRFINKKTFFIEYMTEVQGNCWAHCAIDEPDIEWIIRIYGVSHYFHVEYELKSTTNEKNSEITG